MNILYILQQSIYNNNGKWLSGDSNLNMAIDLFAEMHNQAPDVHFYVLIAPIIDFADITSYSDLYKGDNVTFISYQFPINAFTNRYAFDPEYFVSVYKILPKIDIVWNNIIELTRNVKTALWQINEKPKIISCNYWLDAPYIGQAKVDRAISYDIRQTDGFECSDLCVFTCESTREAWEQNTHYKFSHPVIESILNKSTIWDFGYLHKNIHKEHKFEIPTVLFLNRLSGINYTNHLAFIDAVNSLWEERQDFQVFFTNPSQKVSEEWLQENVKPYKQVMKTPLSRSQYFDLLAKSHISCHLFQIELYGGCAHREAVDSGLLTITPKVYEYERIHGDNYAFYCKDDFSNLKDTISEAVDAIKAGYKTHQNILDRNYMSSFEYNVEKVRADLNKLVSR